MMITFRGTGEKISLAEFVIKYKNSLLPLATLSSCILFLCHKPLGFFQFLEYVISSQLSTFLFAIFSHEMAPPTLCLSVVC